MRFIFFIVVLIHGIIHLLGFIKAFFETDISIQLVGVSKPIGSIWLVAFLLFMVVAIQFLTGEKWFYMFTEARYIFGKHTSNSYPVYLDEFRVSFGLGFTF